MKYILGTRIQSPSSAGTDDIKDVGTEEGSEIFFVFVQVYYNNHRWVGGLSFKYTGLLCILAMS